MLHATYIVMHGKSAIYVVALSIYSTNVHKMQKESHIYIGPCVFFAGLRACMYACSTILMYVCDSYLFMIGAVAGRDTLFIHMAGHCHIGCLGMEMYNMDDPGNNQ